ncbi:MAG: hypothetical protein A2X36_15190 [Elusimicrobia bacterium GWA2_69_24]|nr:MAG: hypothetical protein A2X36_15190 [Elusimicrobia bacterium GWA2_69_24]
MILAASDSSGKTTEVPIDIEEAAIDYQPRYAQLEVRRRSSARKTPAADAAALSTLAPRTVVAALGEKDGWYFLEGGGWLAREDARELDVYAQPSSKPIVFTPEKAAGVPRIVRSVSDVDVNIPERGRKDPDAVAVVIGIKDYKNKDVPAVAYALDDARVVREYLLKAFGVPEENLIYLENPTQGDLVRVFGSQADPKGQLSDFVKAGKSDVLVYYSGHGAPDLETHAAYFVPADAHPNYVKLNGYPLAVFYENLAKLKARSVTAVIDSCFSGASHKGMLVSQASPLYISAVAMDPHQGLNVFTSSADQEISSWFSAQGHSLYTYYFLKAVQEGLGKGGTLSNGRVRDSIAERLPAQARKLFGRTQTPAFTGDAEAPLLGVR